MITVIVCGQKPEQIARLTSAVLVQYGPVRLRLPDVIADAGEGEPLYSVETACRLERLSVPHSVLLLADQGVPRRLEMGGNTIVVTGSDNRRMTRLLKGKANPVITCGTGVRDTVTLSSSSGERAILCVQRRVPAVAGSWLEPFEFAVTIKDCDMRSALLTAAAAAACGCDLSGTPIVIDGRGLRV